MSPRSAYDGSTAKLAIAIDVGTTYSGVSYTFLIPGEVSRIYDVTGFKGQENKDSNTKVPSVLFYTFNGELVACGAETKCLESESGIRTEWFKLEMRPASMRINTPPVILPPGLTLIDVFGDFLKYMVECVRVHILKTHVDGQKLWSHLRSTAHFVLSHPNGWGSFQQSRMREAAVRGGVVPNTPEGRERIEFVTEGEASFHWCIEQSIAGSALKEGTSIVVADLGGGTIDVSSFLVKTCTPLRLQEKMAPECALEGSITVTERFVTAMHDRLQGTPFDDEEYMETLREEFDEKTKCLFRDEPDRAVYIKIGRRRDNYGDENNLCKIRNGMLETQRDDIEEAFEPSITATVNAIYRHVDGQRGAHIFLVGGFAASPWILSETKRRLKALGITNTVIRADSNTAKAVAHGGVAFYLDRYVTERTMRYTYGAFTQPCYDPSNSEHAARTHKRDNDSISGITYVRGGFSTIVKKGESVKVNSVYRKRIQCRALRAPGVVHWEQSLRRYHGSLEIIPFVDMDPSAFDCVGQLDCEIPASALTRRNGQYGAYWAVNYEVVITLGTVEIKCHVEWEENGVKKRYVVSSVVRIRRARPDESCFIQNPSEQHVGGLLLGRRGEAIWGDSELFKFPKVAI